MKAGEIDPADSIMDTDGLNKAYASDNKVYVEGDTLFIAGPPPLVILSMMVLFLLG